MSSQDSSADELQSYFEKSSAVVRRAIDHVDNSYAKPSVDYISQSFEERPVATTFLLIFALLGCVPVLSFVAFTLFTLGTFFSIAICGAALASAVVILAAGGALACTLLCLLAAAAFLTASALAALLLARLALHVRAAGPRDGAARWGRELRGHLRRTDRPAGAAGSLPADAVEAEGVHVHADGKDDDPASESGSTVVVEGVSEEKLKAEE